MYEMPYHYHAVDETVHDLKESLAEFGIVRVRTQELVGAAVWALEIQFDDDDLAVVFKIKYGADYHAELMNNDDFNEGHQVMYIGG